MPATSGSRKKTTRKKSNRQQTGQLWGGSPSDWPINNLPSYSDIARYYYLLKERRPELRELNEFKQIICKDLISKWEIPSPSLPLRVWNAIDNKLWRHLNNIQKRNCNQLKVNQHKAMDENSNLLFDIAACKCQLPVLECTDRKINCKANDCKKTHIHCDCPPDIKVNYLSIYF
jgi:hypothetical protein